MPVRIRAGSKVTKTVMHALHATEELKERNRKFGNANPSSLFAIGRKAIKL